MERFDEILKVFSFYFLQSDIKFSEFVITLVFCIVLALFIYAIYIKTKTESFTDNDFCISMIMISLIVATIVTVSKFSYAISFSAIGALSIIRFRTAIKNPYDLLFMFWQIGNGIICGSGAYAIAYISSLFITVCIIALRIIPKSNVSTYLLSLTINSANCKTLVNDVLKKYCKYYYLDTENIISQEEIKLVYEVKSKDIDNCLDVLNSTLGVDNISLIHHTGNYIK